MKRSYLQFCGLARALDLVGERWTLLVVRELLTGTKRFSQLHERLSGMSPNLLTERLKSMVQQGLVKKEGRLYSLTEFGLELEPIVFGLARWGGATMREGPREGETLDLGWMLLSKVRDYRGGLRGTIGVSVPEREFELILKEERMYTFERVAQATDVRVRAAGFLPLAEVFKRGMSWRERLEVSGDLELWEQFLAKIGKETIDD